MAAPVATPKSPVIADAGVPAAITPVKPNPKKKPYPFWLGGVAASIAASITHPLDLTKVRLQASGDKGMIQSLRKTVRTAGPRGLFDGISATLMRQMSYSLCRFWAYDESKKLIHKSNEPIPPYKLMLAGCMAGGIAGVVGNPGEIIMVRMQGDYAKVPEKRLNYKHCFDGLFRMVREEGFSSLARGMTPNVVRAVLMNASQLASYDYFKRALLNTGYFKDNIGLHFTASFAASTLNAITTAIRNEGPMFMFKGWVPAWSRLQPTTILIFVCLEQLKSLTDLVRGDK
ncbi:hypothetical protein BOTBODRAFT_59592 [Botryobasidium botryosum FD-172 SS1]|uniref:Mitochondrial carrier n=1 Tax=Botryobasidium botryosum (strain FD-172 SS1) TaxID=930990 RepID=A0A067M8Y1_BOTB1|nr:hypothetical protein BOTBODRAFT_59592 [Botryobasidium botryosum FD-172 SS1]